VSAPPALAAAGLYLRAPGDNEVKSFDGYPNLERGFQPGFLQWQSEATGTPVLVEAVNIQTAESDLHAMSPEEFLLRLGAAPTSSATEAPASAPTEPGIARREYGYPVLVLLVIACLLETVVATWPGRPATVEQRTS
jgi:hypothetical protein